MPEIILQFIFNLFMTDLKLCWIAVGASTSTTDLTTRSRPARPVSRHMNITGHCVSSL